MRTWRSRLTEFGDPLEACDRVNLEAVMEPVLDEYLEGIDGRHAGS